MLRIILAVLHLLALGIGLGAVWARARSLGSSPDLSSVRRAFVADTWWGFAAGVWITTGLWRLLASTEKSTSFYMHNHIFFAKMGLLVLVLALEIWPMITLIRWRRAAGQGALDDATISAKAGRIATISYIEAALVLLMVVAAVSMARGVGGNG
jgi:putative membrane protein